MTVPVHARLALHLMVAAAATLPVAAAAQPQIITTNKGIEYEGLYWTIPEYSEVIGNTTPAEGGLNAITMIDDGLRRIYLHYKQIAQKAPLERPFQRLRVWQELTVGQSRFWRFGQLTRSEPFNEYGRRRIQSSGGGSFVQGIVEITPHHTVVAALRDKEWQMRIATTSLPSEMLVPLLRRQIDDPNSITARYAIYDLLLQAGRFQDASAELRSIQEDFPDLTAEIATKREILSQQFARQILGEIRLRMASGQVELALAMAEKIKGPEVAGEILAEIFDIENGWRQSQLDVTTQREELGTHWAALQQAGGLAPEALTTLAAVMAEIDAALNPNNIERLATFHRLASDASLAAEQKVAYAVSGWLSGAGRASDNLALATSLVRVRDLAREYLADADSARRQAILEELAQLEGGDPESLAQVILQLLPPLSPRTDSPLDRPLTLAIELPAPDSGTPRTVEYVVQLPPQYDPYRRYPCLVALHPEGRSPSDELQWWAGAYNANLKMAMGQASRHGYIVMAPAWMLPASNQFEFSAAEHLAVLKSVRDLLRRFSVDTDRVYLTGHFAGGDAAWDIGLSHPDLWAGVIPISAFAGPKGQYAFRSYETAKDGLLPFYFVSGQNDLGRIAENKYIWNQWLTRPDYDVTFVEYQGRLAEPFEEELPAIFEWMTRHVRNPAVTEFTGRTLRPWSRAFWWIDADSISEKNTVLPMGWASRGTVRTAHFDGKFSRNENLFTIQVASGDRLNLWLSPELVDFSKPVTIRGRGDFRAPVTPNRATLLEDVRQRGDRQHPYWARLVCRKSIWSVEP